MTSSSTTTTSEGRAARRLAAVTGASSGIGWAFAQRLAREGYDLVLIARNRDRLEALAKQLGTSGRIRVEVLPADLTDGGALRRVEQRIADDPALDLLVNNAGFGTSGAFATLDPDREEEEIRLNVLALTRLARAALSGMVPRNRGAIINVSSIAAFLPGPYTATYSATKAYVNSFTEALHEELRGTAVRVQALCPGFTRTEFQARAEIDTGGIPAFAWMSPEQVADASLAGLKRGDLICVPGLGNRAVSLLIGGLPRNLVRRVSGIASKRFAG